MKLVKVISGGQTGADVTGLECAKGIGLETGGTAPKGYRTENGPNLELKTKYGLIESRFSNYKDRTEQNVLNSDITLWFGMTNTPGYYATKKAVEKYGKPAMELNPMGLRMVYLANIYQVFNVAGNRYSKMPEVVNLVKQAFGYIVVNQHLKAQVPVLEPSLPGLEE